MEIQLIRHATLLVTINGTKLLVDPMLSEAGANPPIQNSNNDRRNPLVPLPFSVAEMLPVDAILITHAHRDHFDEAAAELLPKDVPVICQPQDEEKWSQLFTHVYPVQDELHWNNIQVIRTEGQHGTGDIGKAMSPVSGFVLQTQGEPSLYIAGDTIWCTDVEQVLQAHHPDVTVVNAGAAQFVSGDPITMTATDVITVCQQEPNTQVIAVHMEAINHCHGTREQLREALTAQELLHRVAIPADGEVVVIPQRESRYS
jgi:L-ascorbate metabolism protein UlaG (beta-lactamase superfamily)